MAHTSLRVGRWVSRPHRHVCFESTFGVLEVDSRSDDEFIEHDLAFLQGAANLLGMAIERERQERNRPQHAGKASELVHVVSPD